MTAPPRVPGDERPRDRLLRRLVTIPAFAGGLVAWGALLPVVLPLSLAWDVARRRRLAATRAAVAIFVYLAFEVFGVLAVTALVVTSRTARRERLFALEAFWADALLGALLRTFGMRLSIEGIDVVAPGPILLLGNHISVADALLPAAFAGARAGLRMRYIAKRELLWDPCVDLSCQFLPNVFVQRGAIDTPGDLARVTTLLDGAGPLDGVSLFPEGTRFTEEKRRAALARREAEGPRERLERDRRLRCLLPPHLGGLLALLDREPRTDFVVMAHTGLEGLVRIGDLWKGRPIGRTLRVAFWRLRAAEIPAGREERIDWFYDQWERLDTWVASARGR